MTRDEVIKIVADATEEVQRGWFEHGLTIMGGNLSRACSEAVLAAFAARGLIIGEQSAVTREFPSELYELSDGRLNRRKIALVRVVE